ncbi:hypothetical protein [Cohnella terricola]|uniref:Uncharacterized protein n=1 Tax=Cohnella terricola TaxID=1289167 RepID=A0A559J8P4_9BACL|nr:hypothetical protein [Cohnella terricola]TVX96260.1 hypothetical protein FPZ45_21370 [Cohnella terricola]
MNNLTWISSIQHLDSFISVAKDSSKLRTTKLPKVRALFSFVPIVYFSRGILNVEERSILYNANKPQNGFFKGYYNLQNDLHFEIDFNEITSIERYKHPNSINDYFNTNWIRIKTSKEILNGDFLVAQHGTGPTMKQVNEGSDRIYKEILSRVNR